MNVMKKNGVFSPISHCNDYTAVSALLATDLLVEDEMKKYLAQASLHSLKCLSGTTIRKPVN